MLRDGAVVTDGAKASRAGRREWIGLAVIALPCLLYSMDLTVLNLAVPQISADLAPSSAELLWIIDIYGFLVAGSMITMGALGDRIGRRRLLLIGAAAFGVASVVAAFSTSAGMLIAARALLGVAGATLAPSTLSLIRHMFVDSRQRTFAIGVWATSYSIGGAIGPVVGGLLLEHFWWGSAFLIGVPVMALLLVLGPLLLPELEDPDAGPLDLVSAALSLVAVLLAIYGVKRIAEEGLAWLPVTSIAIGAAVGLVFIGRQRALTHPLIDLRLFRARAFSASLSIYALASFVVLGTYIFEGQYLQLVLGLSPLQTALAMAPSFAAFIAGSMIVPRIARRLRPPLAMSGGLAIAAVGFVVLGQVGDGGGLPSELGGALGIAILGSIGVAVYRAAMAHGVPTGVSADAAAIAKATLGGAVDVARHLPHGLADQLLATSRHAFTSAFVLTARIGVVLTLMMSSVPIVATRESRRARAGGRARPTPRAARRSCRRGRSRS